jgi:hypothetical protein
MIPVDVIFLDMDGVLLPFGSAKKKASQVEAIKCDDCIFPNSTMEALTTLLQKVGDISLTIKDVNNKKQTTINGNPVLVLSSTWRAQQQFITDILDSFKGYVAFVEQQQQHKQQPSIQNIWKPHLDSFFDLVDPCYHATRHDEIFAWLRENERGKNCRNNNSNKKRKRRTPQELDCTATMVDFQVRSWIALDDEDLVNVEEDRVEKKAIPHAVKTESSVGLTLRDVDRGVKLIEDQMNAFYHLT